MKRRLILRILSGVFLIVALSGIPNFLYAQKPPGDFGFGLILGDPLGGTVKYWVSANNALVADIGESYFGVPRIDLDYLWHFNSFNSRIVLLYGGIGGAVGFGYDYNYYGVFYNRGDGRPFYYRYGATSSVGIGVRAIFGLTIVPKRTPLEFFIEAGPLLGIVPNFGVGFDLAVGVRFYP